MFTGSHPGRISLRQFWSLSALHSILELVVHSVILVGITYVLFRPEASRYFRGIELSPRS